MSNMRSLVIEELMNGFVDVANCYGTGREAFLLEQREKFEDMSDAQLLETLMAKQYDIGRQDERGTYDPMF